MASKLASKADIIQSELLMRSIKLIDIGYVTIIYFLLAIMSEPLVNMILGTYDPIAEQAKSNIQIVFEVILRVWILSILGYIVRNIVPLIPFPLDGFHGFQHSRVKEVISGAVFASYIVTFDTTLQSKVSLLRSRLFGSASTAFVPIVPNSPGSSKGG